MTSPELASKSSTTSLAQENSFGLSELTLPAELEREIFETTALMHPQTIPALLRVARRVLIWIEPFMYRIVRLKGRNMAGRTLLKAIRSKPPEVFNGVRHLTLESSYSAEEAKELLRLCSGIVDFCSIPSLGQSVLPILAQMHVRRLALALCPLFGDDSTSVDLAHPAFRSITHLDIFDDMGDLEPFLSQIPTLPALTHLSLEYDVPKDVAMEVLRECPRLQLLLVQWPGFMKSHYELARIPHVYDVRFVMEWYDVYLADWEAGARGHHDVWSRGDDFVARKRRGEIEETRYWLT